MTGLLLDDPAYFDRLARADRSHWWSAAMWDVASAWLDFASRGQRDWTALDVGCGHGATLERLASREEIARVVGVEPSAEALIHHRSLNCEIFQANAQSLPFDAAEFDLATCFDVFQHLPEGDDKIAAHELRRVVRPGGWILIRANGRGLWPSDSSRSKLYRLSDLVGVLEGAGFCVIRSSYLNCMPGVASEIVGKMLPGSRHGHPSGRGLRIERGRAWTGRLMGLIAGAETMFAGRWGGRLPIGHSTLVLAQNSNPGEIMRIGFDGGCLSNRRGFGRFARQTLQALSEADSGHEFVVFLDGPSREMVEIPSNFQAAIVDVKEAPSKAASATGRRTVRDLLTMGRAASRSHLDLMYFPASYSFFPVWNAGKVVVTLHDTLALAHPELVFPTNSGRLAWKLKEHAAVRWSDRIVTVSQTARDDLIAWFGLPGDKVSVVPEAPESVFRPMPNSPESAAVLKKYRIDPSRIYLLYVGGLSPHKNLTRLLGAFAKLVDKDVELVLVGDTGDVFHTHVPELKRAVRSLGIADRVNFTGFVPDEDLAHLYCRAYALVQPSLMEGFGLPPVEAMACGTPVLSSRAGSLPEVVADAGVFFDPRDETSMSTAIGGLLIDPQRRRALAAVALKRAETFTWSSTAKALLEVFRSLDASPAKGRAA